MKNARYAELLNEISDLMQVRGDNAFRVRAFQRAARVLDGISENVDDLLDAGTITDLDGIGKSIAEDLAAMRQDGTCALLEELRDELPDGIPDMLGVRGLGPKNVKKLYEELGIGDLDALESAAQAGQIASLKGFGQKTEDNILKEIQRLRSHAGRTPVAKAWPIAATLLDMLRALDDVQAAEIAGSLRRGRETVGDLDFVVASDNPEPIMKAFVENDEVAEVIAHGDTKSSVHLKAGLSADLRVVPLDVFGATLHHFTGSKEHNILMRARAQKRGLRISEWGVFKRDGDEEKPVASTTEEDIFRAVDLPFIPPELREDRGEVEAAESDHIPDLPTVDDIRSDLHMHTTASDGRHSIAQMAQAAAARGLTHIAITDHSESLKIANGLSPDRLHQQIDDIEAYNADAPALRVLAGLEVDIMEHGDIDMNPEVLSRCDWIVGSVHQWMNQDAKTMTQRLLRAIDSGLLSAIGHPTGRIIGRRDPFEFDIDAIFSACAKSGVALELNASPWRLDLNDQLLRRALEYDGLLFTINTDAHSTDELEQMHFGVRMARRGWLPTARILNTLELDDFLNTRLNPGNA